MNDEDKTKEQLISELAELRQWIAQLEASETERKKAEEEWREYHLHLEEMVERRTTELTLANEQLQREIAERKQAEQAQDQLLKELETANQELKDFAYIVSHELKAPLRAISSLANWILTDYADKFDENGKEQMDLLVGRVKRLHDSIDGVLQYSRIGRIREEKVVVDLDKLVAEVIDTIVPQGDREMGVKDELPFTIASPEHIEIKVEDKLPSVLCERTRIEQVFQNLLSNAVKFMDKPKGEIRIGCVEEEEYWKFSVADNGPGIEEKHFGRIFQMFQTLRPRDESESTGIGLSLVKRIIEMYGGRIWMESEVGHGSTFYFTLPKGGLNSHKNVENKNEK